MFNDRNSKNLNLKEIFAKKPLNNNTNSIRWNLKHLMMQVVKHVLVKCTRFTKLYLLFQRLIFDILSHDNFVLGFVKPVEN